MRAKVFFSYPLRFENENGELEYIEPELVEMDTASKDVSPESSLKGYSYESKAGPYKTYIPSSLTEDRVDEVLDSLPD